MYVFFHLALSLALQLVIYIPSSKMSILMPNSSSPVGRYYMPESPLPELSVLECWTEDLSEKFVAEQVPKSKRILTAGRRADMKDWLLHLNRISQDPDPAVQQKFANDKAWTNKNFELQSG
jgi:hypothetical protein